MFPASETIGVYLGFVVGAFEGHELELKNQGFIKNFQKLDKIELKRQLPASRKSVIQTRTYTEHKRRPHPAKKTHQQH